MGARMRMPVFESGSEGGGGIEGGGEDDASPGGGTESARSSVSSPLSSGAGQEEIESTDTGSYEMCWLLIVPDVRAGSGAFSAGGDDAGRAFGTGSLGGASRIMRATYSRSGTSGA